MSDLDLFAPGRAVRRSDPDTSRLAAQKAANFAGRHHQLILATLKAHPNGLTIHAIADCVGIDHVAVGRRCPELERGGLIERTNERRTHNGRTGQVWKVRQEGRKSCPTSSEPPSASPLSSA